MSGIDIIIASFKIWNVLFLFGFLLIAFRSDAREMFMEIFGQLLVQGILSFIFSVIVIYVLIPLTIPYSIKNIFKS